LFPYTTLFRSKKHRSKSLFYLLFHFGLNPGTNLRDCTNKNHLSLIFQSRIRPYQSTKNLPFPNKKAIKQKWYNPPFRHKNDGNFFPNFLGKNSSPKPNGDLFGFRWFPNL